MYIYARQLPSLFPVLPVYAARLGSLNAESGGGLSRQYHQCCYQVHTCSYVCMNAFRVCVCVNANSLTL